MPAVLVFRSLLLLPQTASSHIFYNNFTFRSNLIPHVVWNSLLALSEINLEENIWSYDEANKRRVDGTAWPPEQVASIGLRRAYKTLARATWNSKLLGRPNHNVIIISKQTLHLKQSHVISLTVDPHNTISKIIIMYIVSPIEDEWDITKFMHWHISVTNFGRVPQSSRNTEAFM
jgi:hypothetical protein